MFDTNVKPGSIHAVDVISLTRGDYLHPSYHETLLEGHEKFAFNTIPAMLNRFPTYKHAVSALNEFRAHHGLATINPEEMPYCEVCFYRPTPITPVALVGSSNAIKLLAKKHGLPRYDTYADYLHSRFKLRLPNKQPTAATRGETQRAKKTA